MIVLALSMLLGFAGLGIFSLASMPVLGPFGPWILLGGPIFGPAVGIGLSVWMLAAVAPIVIITVIVVAIVQVAGGRGNARSARR